ncbi:MAG: hypothetical protein K0R65_2325 [Crocinitomicaceae bacterium]|jgi:SAM-dependent methyltransferase|nr:hypothetical protein [Crocinitomicaceae bacterium]
MNKLKQLLKRIPALTKLVQRMRNTNAEFPGSSDYWEKRYHSGGNSGSGSYGRLALYKAEVLNAFVAEKGISSVLEFGCGDGHQLSLAKYPRYTGLDVSETAIKICSEQFKGDGSKSFYLYGDEAAKQLKSELSMSIDVIFHLVEDSVFEDYMQRLFSSAEKFVVIYSSNYNNKQTFHEKTREFAQWITQNEPEWKLVKKLDNPYPYNPKDPDNTSQSDFYFYERM